MQESFIKIYRKIFEWRWYQDSRTVHLFLHLLLEANFKDGFFMGTLIKRGQAATGRKSLSVQLGMTEMMVRTRLEKLVETNEITIKTTNHFSIITLCNYEKYQSKQPSKQPTDNQPITNQQPTDNQPITTIEEGKEGGAGGETKETKEKELNTTSCDSQKSEPLPQFEKSDSAKTNDPPETVGAAAPPKTGKKEPFKQPETKPKPEPLHVPCKKIFMDFFKDRNGVDYYWRGRDGKAINSIIKQLRGRGTGDTEIPDVFKTILNKIEDKWMLSNLDVSLLDSKFNQVITKIKNETKQLSYEEIKSEFKRRAEQHG